MEALVREYQLKITAFVTGKTLEDNPEVLDYLKSMRAEIEQHSYSHDIDHHHQSRIKDIEKGIEIHQKIVGKAPLGYRAPQGIIVKEEALFLRENGLVFDSSIFPAFFPGRFNRSRSILIKYMRFLLPVYSYLQLLLASSRMRHCIFFSIRLMRAS